MSLTELTEEYGGYDDLQAVPEFRDFGKIARFRTLVATVTEKIDGSNMQVFVPADDKLPLWAGSRNRWISPDKDCFGFARFVADNESAFRNLGQGRHFGEWWGYKIQRHYGLTDKRFSLFNRDRFTEGLPPAITDLSPRIGFVPLLYSGPVDTQVIKEVVQKLYRDGSQAVPGWTKPEGVVITIGGHRWKITDNDDAHKGRS